MIVRRWCHKSVSVKNKLFVVGGWGTPNCEVYDSTCNKFVSLKSPPASFTSRLICTAGVISIGSKLAVFRNRTNSILFYDAQKDEWFEKSCELTRNLQGYRCAKLPHL